MLLDLGAVDRYGVAAALDTALRERAVRLDVVRGAVASHSRQGRSGIVALRRAVEARVVDGRPVDSDLETRMSALCRRYGLPAMEFHATVAGYEVDFLVVGAKVVVECDGWQWHGLDRDQFEFDRARDAQLLAAGYVTVRVTWRQLRAEPARVAQRIRCAVDAFSERKVAETA
jgi:very-short-patch-repair endonuclease